MELLVLFPKPTTQHNSINIKTKNKTYTLTRSLTFMVWSCSAHCPLTFAREITGGGVESPEPSCVDDTQKTNVTNG